MYVLTPVFSRFSINNDLWSEVRSRIGPNHHWVLAIDGDPDVPWHEVRENVELARKLGNSTVLLGFHGGNGAAMESMVQSLPPHEPFIKLDSDVLPSEHFIEEFLDMDSRMKDLHIGLIAGLPNPGAPRWPVGYRMMLPGQRLLLRVAYFSRTAVHAIPSHRTVRPINDHDMLVIHALRKAHLRTAYTHRVWVEAHPGLMETSATDHYNQWKQQYLPTRQ